MYFKTQILEANAYSVSANNKLSPYIVQYFFSRFVFDFPGFDPTKERMNERREKTAIIQCKR